MKKERLIKLRILAGVTLLFSLLFVLVDKAPIGPKGTVVGFSHFNAFFSKIFTFKNAFYIITNILGYLDRSHRYRKYDLRNIPHWTRER